MDLSKLVIRRAEAGDFDEVMALYDAVIDRLKDVPESPRWTRGMYPTDEMIREDIEEGGLFTGTYDNRIIASMVLNHESNDGYDEVDWKEKLENQDVFFVHLVAVHPDYFRMGIAESMMEYAIRLAEKSGIRAIRLDVVEGNLPAEKLYLKKGFRYVETSKLYYEDTGWMNFRLFEYMV